MLELDVISADQPARQNHDTEQQEQLSASSQNIKPTRKRYLILALFVAGSLTNAFQWIYLSSITKLVTQYYGVTNVAVNWTSMIYMFTYIPLIVPASWLFERIGMRKSVALGSLGTSIGATIKCFACKPNLFGLLMFGQTISAISQLFVLSVPPRLASVWFPDDQVSLANAVGVFGNQLGIALGFVVPGWLINVQDVKDIASIEQGLYTLYLAIAIISIITSLLILIYFDKSPTHPPGAARLRQMIQENANATQPLVQTDDNQRNFKDLMFEYVRDRDFKLLFIGYGLNTGVFYAISTILNQMLAPSWPDSNELTGRLGITLVIAGMFGSVASGILLDKTHLYRLVNVFMYLISLSSTILFAFVIETQNRWSLFMTVVTMGYFMTGYLLIGYEISNEITWPRPESVSAGLLNLSAQVSQFSILFCHFSIASESH